MKSIQIITCTGDRPKTFTKSCDFVKEQTFSGNIHWHVFDDGNRPEETYRELSKIKRNIEINHIISPKKRSEGNSVYESLYAVLSYATNINAPIVNMDDDDVYKPEWLRIFADTLVDFDLVGQAPAIYYNIKNRTYQKLSNKDYASFSSTGFTHSVIPLIKRAMIRREKWPDQYIWKNFQGKSKIIEWDQNPLVLGIKGMYLGIEETHADYYMFKNNDLNGKFLKKHAPFYYT